MKQSTFVSIVILAAIVISILIYWFILGSPANFKDGENRQRPDNLMGTSTPGESSFPRSSRSR